MVSGGLSVKKFLKSPWTVGIGTGVISGIILTVICDLIKDISVLSTLQTILKFLWSCIVNILNFNIKVWWILIAIAVIFVALLIIAKIYDTKLENNSKSFLSYTSDYLVGYSWEWTWKKDWDGKYGVENLHPVCTKCKTPLVPTDAFRDKMKCLRCGDVMYHDQSKEKDALVLIYDNAKKKYSNN